jgi:hypothetical protein
MSLPRQIQTANLIPPGRMGDWVLGSIIRPRRLKRRTGLAPVELVLSAPLVLMVMALSVIVGNAACWKIRAAVVARNEIWAYRKPRTDIPLDTSATWPAGWPQSASMNHSTSRPLTDLDFPAFQNPLLRGPLPNVTVNSSLLNPTLSVRVGSDQIQRTPPLLARLGDYSFNIDHPLIDGPWAYWQTRQYSNQSDVPNRVYRESLRFPALYPDVPPQNSPEKSAFDSAVQDVKQFLSNGQLAVLDGDQELHDWFYPNTYDPPLYDNFHPGVRFCSMDPNYVHASYIANPGGLLARIAAVPKRITDRFLSMYNQQLAILQNMMPPPDAEIQALEQKIQILNDYRATLP